MTEKENIPSPEIGKEEIFTLGDLGSGGLPEDLGNDTFSINLALSLYETGKYSDDQLRDVLKSSRSFEDYFRGQVKEHNEMRRGEGQQLYDEDVSLRSEIDRIKPGLIDEFDKKILELHELADAENIDKEAIKKIIWEGIDPIINGNKK